MVKTGRNRPISEKFRKFFIHFVIGSEHFLSDNKFLSERNYVSVRRNCVSIKQLIGNRKFCSLQLLEIIKNKCV